MTAPGSWRIVVANFHKPKRRPNGGMLCYRCATPVPDQSRFCNSCGADLSGPTGERTQPVDVDPELEIRLREELKGEFLLDREIGRGGMAVVFLAHDPNLGRKVAIKVLPPDITFGAGIIERFKREARTAATLDHPHVIPIHKISTGGKLFWYVMKYVEGESLADQMKRAGPVSLDQAADVLGQVAEALEYAHQHDVIHRDVKPGNVMIDHRGWVTVTDFGIAKALGTQSLTGSGSMIGTPHYMSPEQCSGTGVTAASDQYSLGVVAYQMLTGHVPFTGESVVDIIKKHCFDPIPPIDVLRPDAPLAAIAAVEQALAKAPEGRFDSVTGFARAFQRAVHHAPDEVQHSGAPMTPGPRISGTLVVNPVAEGEPATPAPALAASGPAEVSEATGTPKRRLPWRVATVAVAVVALAAAGAAIISRMRPTERALASVDTGTSLKAPPAAAVPVDSTRAESTAVVTRADTAARPADTVPATRPRLAHLEIQDVPPGAVITLDGRRVRDTALVMSPARRHVVRVTLSGHRSWVDTLVPREGERISTNVILPRAVEGVAMPSVSLDSDGDGVADNLDRCPNTPRATPVDSNGCPRDTDGDGVADNLDRCPNTPANARPVDANGCPVDTDGDGVADYLDRCSSTPRGVPVDANGCPPDSPIAVPSRPAAPVPGFITVGSDRPAAMTINGRPAGANPVVRYQVPAGRVSISFFAINGDSVWSLDTTVTVGPGQTTRLGVIHLPRRP